MSFFCNGPSRTSDDALPTLFVPKKEAILSVVAESLLAGRKLQEADHAADSNRYPFWRYETIA